MSRPPPLPQHRPQTSWPAVIVSLAAYPGLGQLMQRRWIVGGILTAFTTIAGGWLLEAMIAGAAHNFRVGIETGHSDVAGYLCSLAAPAKLFGIAWLLSAVDIVIAHWRLMRKAAR